MSSKRGCLLHFCIFGAPNLQNAMKDKNTENQHIFIYELTYFDFETDLNEVMMEYQSDKC